MQHRAWTRAAAGHTRQRVEKERGRVAHRRWLLLVHGCLPVPPPAEGLRTPRLGCLHPTQVIVFGDDTVLNKPVEEWPVVQVRMVVPRG